MKGLFIHNRIWLPPLEPGMKFNPLTFDTDVVPLEALYQCSNEPSSIKGFSYSPCASCPLFGEGECTLSCPNALNLQACDCLNAKHAEINADNGVSTPFYANPYFWEWLERQVRTVYTPTSNYGPCDLDPAQRCTCDTNCGDCLGGF